MISREVTGVDRIERFDDLRCQFIASFFNVDNYHNLYSKITERK